MEYEGVANNDLHREWLDSTLDRCVLHLVGKDKEFTKGLGADSEFTENAHKYFAGR